MNIRETFADAAPALLALMPDVCAVTRFTEEPDRAGGSRTVWSPAATGVPCKVSVARRGGQSERIVAARQASVIAYSVTMPLGTDVTSEDRIVLSDGRTFEVVGVANPSVRMAVRAACIEEL